MKELKFEYRDGHEFVSWVGNTNEAGSSTVADLQKSQPGTWALVEPSYEAWKVETTKPDSEAAKQKKADEKQAAEKRKTVEEKAVEQSKTAQDQAAKDKKAAADEDEEDQPWKAPDRTKGTKK